ncbi:hypothetical protein PDG61_16840 [Mycolicibacterium sp. BiH015]|nr:hypothetical protein [Mycolicibacterium sp. BiH015]MDA2892589.1 hypothetical protein [Mycolicibacterium sp. BiH015]
MTSNLVRLRIFVDGGATETYTLDELHREQMRRRGYLRNRLWS